MNQGHFTQQEKEALDGILQTLYEYAGVLRMRVLRADITSQSQIELPYDPYLSARAKRKGPPIRQFQARPTHQYLILHIMFTDLHKLVKELYVKLVDTHSILDKQMLHKVQQINAFMRDASQGDDSFLEMVEELDQLKRTLEKNK